MLRSYDWPRSFVFGEMQGISILSRGGYPMLNPPLAASDLRLRFHFVVARLTEGSSTCQQKKTHATTGLW